MPVHVQSRDLPFGNQNVETLWQQTCELMHHTDDTVSILAVSREEIQSLNNTYRKKDKPTNVLTFSYGQTPGAQEHQDHDVVLCLDVAKEEATDRNIKYADYVALLLTHAFLHVCGLDHERSTEEEQDTRQKEEFILKASGFSPIHLS